MFKSLYVVPVSRREGISYLPKEFGTYPTLASFSLLEEYKSVLLEALKRMFETVIQIFTDSILTYYNRIGLYAMHIA